VFTLFAYFLPIAMLWLLPKENPKDVIAMIDRGLQSDLQMVRSPNCCLFCAWKFASLLLRFS